MKLNKMEKEFLIDCIITSACEGFYLNRISVTNEEIIDLMNRLGATKEDIEKFNDA